MVLLITMTTTQFFNYCIQSHDIVYILVKNVNTTFTVTTTEMLMSSFFAATTDTSLSGDCFFPINESITFYGCNNVIVSCTFTNTLFLSKY